MDTDSAKVQAAAETAQQLIADTIKATDERTVKIIQEFFSQGEKRKRFIDVNRIPFICDDIREIHAKVDNLARLIYIGSGIVIATGALLGFVLKSIVK